ncbi:hypothetical protein QUB05_16480 [Microcoleus sp. F10-C6]
MACWDSIVHNLHSPYLSLDTGRSPQTKETGFLAVAVGFNEIFS